AAVLVKVLEAAAAEGLPPIAWTVATAGMELRGECLAHSMDARRDAFNTWRAAVGTWAGRIADRESERTGDDGTTRLAGAWEGVKVPGMQGLTAARPPHCAEASSPHRAGGASSCPGSGARSTTAIRGPGRGSGAGGFSRAGSRRA